jgi:hypothetical protein
MKKEIHPEYKEVLFLDVSTSEKFWVAPPNCPTKPWNTKAKNTP